MVCFSYGRYQYCVFHRYPSFLCDSPRNGARVCSPLFGRSHGKERGQAYANPVPHIDPVGSLLMPFLLILFQSPFLFGWAKPVPINSFNLRDQKYGSAKVSFAGPAANFGIAVVFGLLLRFFSAQLSAVSPDLILFFRSIVELNLILGIFNLVPIPPLDGSHILFDFLPRSFSRVKQFLSQYGIFVLLFFMFFLFQFLVLPIQWLFRLLVGF